MRSDKSNTFIENPNFFIIKKQPYTYFFDEQGLQPYTYFLDEQGFYTTIPAFVLYLTRFLIPNCDVSFLFHSCRRFCKLIKKY